MTGQLQCDNCGAVLLEEDLFCGECGAPRPSLAEALEAAEAEQSAVVEQPVTPAPPPYTRPRPAPARPSRSPEAGWRVAVTILIVLGVLACIAGLISFFVFGSMESEAATVSEDWLYSGMCCLLPIGGAGSVLLAVGGVLWYTRVRKR
jgi:hypothetical protein